MKISTTLTGAMLQQTHAAARPYLSKLFWQCDFFKCIFSRYVAGGEYDPGTTSRFFTGERIVPHGLLETYAAYDTASPRCPPLLKADLDNVLKNTIKSIAARSSVYFAIKKYVSLLPELDRRLLMEFASADDMVTAESLSTFWTAVLWYAVCQDRSIAFRRLVK